MKTIDVRKPDPAEIEKRKMTTWPIWEKEVSEFDWYYDNTEECYILDGEVTVTGEDGKTVTFGPGDFVTFPQGLSCTWKITRPVRKHYNFHE